ncbi:hypothetical protein SASPL_117647 [Salvia splendens]|uniref:Glycosyltransferase 61 catalytic domain-containing protein n=1 Tax=Salvia splendens TaxID=180675 RepID=A0A8X8Y051_SALSN|nr:hypothetical protein SASPL_117647 [Salvia splendens]
MMGFEKIDARSNWWQQTLTFTAIICMITMALDFTAVSKSTNICMEVIRCVRISKYEVVTSVQRKTLETLSKYEVVDIDREKKRTLCFTNLIAELIAHPSDLSIDPSPFSRLSTRNLTRLLPNTYSLKRDSVGDHIRPRMLNVSRTKNRKLANELELARKLGFDPAIHDLGDHLEPSAKIVNTFDVMAAVHGSALTNMLFLPENAGRDIMLLLTKQNVNLDLARFKDTLLKALEDLMAA